VHVLWCYSLFFVNFWQFKCVVPQSQEAAAIEALALAQIEERKAKFTSEEAVKACRAAVKRRVAAKLARQAAETKAAEAAEAERKERINQVGRRKQLPRCFALLALGCYSAVVDPAAFAV
jgi:hypothetical protein